jgi:1-acyl-sn-glycerol-3-phosphate acyltransferase
MSRYEGAISGSPPLGREILQWPLPHQGPADRLLLRALALVARSQVRSISGLENLRPAMDPFILVANHSTRREALLMPALMVLHRGGRLIHFLADWNFCLIPGVGLIYRRSGAIIIARKPARPRVLNLFKPLFVEDEPALEQARTHLLAGRSVGMFPEGTVNRDPTRLLAGRSGAARLSLETGAPIVPMGIRFPDAHMRPPSPGPMEIRIGAPLYPTEIMPGPAPLAAVRAWHAMLMTEIGRLSGKICMLRGGESHDARR